MLFDMLCVDDTKDDPFWDIVRNLLHDPSEEQVKCHYPKSILLDTGEVWRQFNVEIDGK